MENIEEEIKAYNESRAEILSDMRYLKLDFRYSPTTNKPGHENEPFIVDMWLEAMSEVRWIVGNNMEWYPDPTKKSIWKAEQGRVVSLIRSAEKSFTKILNTQYPGEHLRDYMFKCNLLSYYSDFIEPAIEAVESYDPEKKLKKKPQKQSTFRDLIIYEDPDKLLERLHELFEKPYMKDQAKGSYMMLCRIMGYIERYPKEEEFEVEFGEVKWGSLKNNMLNKKQGAGNYQRAFERMLNIPQEDRIFNETNDMIGARE